MRLRPLPVIAALIAGLGLLTALFVTISYVRYGSDAAVRRYIREHSSDVAVACFDPALSEGAFFHNADTPFALASTFKLALLAGYADQVADGKLDPSEQIPLAELDRFYLPATDGDAHSQFLASLEEGRQTIALDEIVSGMVVYGSNAAADYLGARLEATGLAELYRRLGLQGMDMPFSYLGLYLFMTNHETGEYAEEEISLAEVRSEQRRLEQLFTTDPAWRAEEIAYLHDQAHFAPLHIQKDVLGRYGMSGSARDLAQILVAAYGYTEALPADAQQIMRRHLEWPLRADPATAEQFDVFATLTGAWPGTLSAAWYADAAGEPGPLVLVVLYDEMPDDFWNAWLVNFSHQVLETKALAAADCGVFAIALE